MASGAAAKAARRRSEPAPEDAGEEERARRDELLLGEALALAGEQDFESGLACLGSGVGGKCRQAVLHGTQARYCLRAGRTKAGRELLLALYDRLEQWNLLDWEPELGAQIISLLISSGGGKVHGDMRRRLYSLHAATAHPFIRITLPLGGSNGQGIVSRTQRAD